jgi:hypothetical protein
MVISAVGGCAYNPFLPDLRTPVDRAREIAPRCHHTSEALDAEVLSASVVENVEPYYDHVQSGNDRMVHLRGAKLHVRPQPNLSAESIERSLECHEARVTMGGAPPLASDPYTLAGTWLDIKTDSTGDGYVVAVQVNNIQKAREVLARARQFATARP